MSLIWRAFLATTILESCSSDSRIGRSQRGACSNPAEMQRSESVIKAERAGWLTTFAAEDTNVGEALLDEANGRLDDVFAEVHRRGIWCNLCLVAAPEAFR